MPANRESKTLAASASKALAVALANKFLEKGEENMKKENLIEQDETKTDLKHDTMEFSAATDGDDVLDTDDAAFEEEAVSAEELDTLNDDEEDEAAALINVENELLIDEDNLPEEDWIDDLPDTISDEADDDQEI